MKNVLVVDSDQVMLQTLSGLLKNQGGFLNVFEAANTKQAIDLLGEAAIDIVITAIRLPKVDGFRLVSKFTKEFPSIKVIIMTKGSNPLLRASIKRFPTVVHLDQAHDIGMLTKRVFTELQIDYGGQVRGINLSSFLQMMELERCTCTLRVTSRELTGTLWLENGEVVAAESKSDEGLEAALTITAWKNVFIDIDYAPHEVKRQIDMPLMTLLIESGKRDDEKKKSTNKRGHLRYDLLVAIDYDMRNMTRQCSLRDISLGGAYIETEQDMQLGEAITLVLSSPTVDSSCSIKAEVVRKDGKGTGVKFHPSSPEQQQIVKIMIENSLKSGQYRQQEGALQTPAV